MAQNPIVPGGTKYPAKAHARRVAAELNVLKGLILLKGAEQRFYPESDQPIPFRQNRQFYYLTGCNEPGCWTTYEVEKDKLTLWIPKPNQGRAIFYDGRACTKKDAKERYDVDEVKIIHGPGPKRTNLRKVLFDHYENGGEYAFFMMPRQIIGKKLRLRMKERRKAGLRVAMNKCRAVKDEYEVALIRKANTVSAEAHTDIMKQLHFLKSEPEVEALYLSTCIAHGAKKQSYGPICGSGANAGQLHYMKNNQDFGDSAQVLLVDAGAEWQQYASDITRSMPINMKNPGYWATPEAEAVYNWVATIQEECIQQLAPGKKFIDIAWHAVHRSIDALLHLGILKGEHMDIFHAGTVLAFFPHGLGHHVGLEVHDPSAKVIRGAGKNGKGMKVGPKKGGPGRLDKGKGNMQPLPDGWEQLKNPNGRVYYADHNTKTTHWKRPGQGGAKKAGPGNKGPKAGLKNVLPVGGKKPSWGKTPADPEKAVLFDQEAEKVEKKDGEKTGEKKGKGKGKQAGAANKPAGPQDARFKRTQGAYRAFSAGNEALMPKALGRMPAHYSLRPRFCKAPNTPTSPPLAAGNVITVEPGLYFNKFMLNNHFLKNKKHAQFVDKDVLAKFMGVGGVRVEDTVLITETGCEVLSAGAPKGAEMLGLIKEGARA